MCALNREDLTPPAEGWSALQVAGKGRGLHRLPINRPAAHALLARPNLRAAQEPLGHAWVTTTQRHTHLAAEDLQGRMAQLPANPAV
jgi:site-specific recombinase XerC